MDFKPGDTVVKKNDMGIPGLTLNEYVVSRPTYKKYGQEMVDLVGGSGSRRYSTMYPADLFEVLTDERREWLRNFHSRQRSAS